MAFHEYLLAIPVALLLGWLARRMFRDVRRARETGVTDFLFQWPDGFARDSKPVAFWWTTAVYTGVGVVAAAMAAGAVVIVVLSIAAKAFA